MLSVPPSASGKVRLRNFREGDLPAMHAMDQLCFRKGIAYSKAELGYYARNPDVLTLIAEDDVLVGFAMAEVVRLRGELSGHVVTIDVHPDGRRRGVGRLLMEKIEAWLRGQQISTCSLEVAADDAGALSFYHRLSYSAAGKIRGYYMGQLDAYVLRKALASSD